MREYWKDIPGFVGTYQVSNMGRVRSLDAVRPHGRGPRQWRGRILSTFRGEDKYRACTLWAPGKVPVYMRVHVLVATCFLGPRTSSKHQVNHKNGDKTNSTVSNLEWVTEAANHDHATCVLGVRGKKLTTRQVVEIKQLILSERDRYRTKGSGGLYQWLAQRYHVGVDTIYRIRDGKAWTHV